MKTRKTWEKLLGIFLAVVLILGMIPVAQLLMRDKDVQSNAGLSSGDTIYFKPTDDWKDANARFAAYFCTTGQAGGTWVDCSDSNGDGIYECKYPGSYPNIIFCRFNPSSTTNA